MLNVARSLFSRDNMIFIVRSAISSARTNTNMKQHILINHGTKEDREKEFTYYCKYCDYGTFSKPLYKTHKQTKKHKNIVELLSKIIEI